ncbi:biotin transport system substrate-specific component [Ruminococcaceae bacterium R-25]|nr:biotin transport system substrate-specific component [Ruminococcaceae bacterium R-25]SUQ10925.1 biotin transport system substrate-specific component [Oscillospiraceae bacterium]
MSESSSKTNKSTKNRAFIYDLVLISVSAALITICSWISIPLGPVPFTLQTLGILAVMLTVGGRRGTIAILVYLALGAVGVPVFAGFKGGIMSFVGPTGGFLIGFVIAALVYWLLEKLFLKKLMTTTVRTWIFGLLGFLVFEIVMYIVGVIWFMTVYAAQTGPVGLMTVLGWCVIPFIIPDLVKMAVALIIGERASKLTKF